MADMANERPKNDCLQTTEMRSRGLGRYLAQFGLCLFGIVLTGFALLTIVRQGIAGYCFDRSLGPGLPIQDELRLLRAAVRLEPPNPQYYEHLGLLYLGKAETGQSDAAGEAVLAVDNFIRTARLSPVNYNIHLYLAKAVYEATGDADKMMAHLRLVELLDPHNDLLKKHKERLKRSL